MSNAERKMNWFVDLAFATLWLIGSLMMLIGTFCKF
jgi:hypothetical protein